MISGQELPERIQKNVAVPWQSQRPAGFSDGIRLGSADAAVTGIVMTYTPTLEVLKRTVASGKNTIICREAPFYSRGERARFWCNGPIPAKELTDNDAVCRFTQDFIMSNNMVIIRLVENRDARATDGQLQQLGRALGSNQLHDVARNSSAEYQPSNNFFQLPETSLGGLAGDPFGMPA